VRAKLTYEVGFDRVFVTTFEKATFGFVKTPAVDALGKCGVAGVAALTAVIRYTLVANHGATLRDFVAACTGRALHRAGLRGGRLTVCKNQGRAGE